MENNTLDNTVKITKLKYGNTKCYLLHGASKSILIDTDWAGKLPAFYHALREKKLRAQGINYLLITHYHPDHMGIANNLINIGIKLIVMDCQQNYIHQSDHIFYKDNNSSFQPINDKKIKVIKINQSRKFLASCGIPGVIISTPGHTNDSISLVLDNGEAFVGDLYPQEQVPLYNNPVLTNSWRKLHNNGASLIHFAHYADKSIISNR
ncbi:MBL fold metallo-hydrolase (plasmid) [Limosilactobacillus reuteri]|uniref:MBL fold metallo-hydrolase n=1 Tax=Limosilactobacillus reuteri TaxID=1598 RepID=UPI003D81BFEB